MGPAMSSLPRDRHAAELTLLSVVGAEVDAQWSGQQKTISAICTFDCVATEAMKIKSIVTGRGRIGLAFDWLMPYVTAGVLKTI